MSKYDLLAKLVVIGDVSVGKTSLINRFAKNEFEENHVFTMGVDYSRLQCRVSDKTVLAELRDTAGQERFRSITGSVSRGANGVVIVYDITDEETFVNVESYWVKFAKENMVEGTVFHILPITRIIRVFQFVKYLYISLRNSICRFT